MGVVASVCYSAFTFSAPALGFHRCAHISSWALGFIIWLARSVTIARTRTVCFKVVIPARELKNVSAYGLKHCLLWPYNYGSRMYSHALCFVMLTCRFLFLQTLLPQTFLALGCTLLFVTQLYANLLTVFLALAVPALLLLSFLLSFFLAGRL